VWKEVKKTTESNGRMEFKLRTLEQSNILEQDSGELVKWEKISSKTRILAVLVGIMWLCNPSRINEYLQNTDGENDFPRLIKSHV
jgi:hypothetical protein